MSKWDDSPDAQLARRLGEETPPDPRPEEFHDEPWFFGLFAGPIQAWTADGPVTLRFEAKGSGASYLKKKQQ